MAAILDPGILAPGDVIVYRPFELLGWIIAARTGARYGHVEVVEVPGVSTVTARADHGVNRYPWDWPKPGMVLRPPAGFSWVRAQRYFARVQGQPYAIWALLTYTMPDPVVIAGQQHCAQFATNLYREAGLTLFGTEPAARVPPGAFTTRADGFTVIWTDRG